MYTSEDSKFFVGSAYNFKSGDLSKPVERDPIEKMANVIPPIPGIEAGWTVIGGNPAAEVDAAALAVGYRNWRARSGNWICEDHRPSGRGAIPAARSDSFNEAMFCEFERRGLQTQTANPCVQNLELYDSFHASESEQNCLVFSSFLRSTLNLSRSEWIAEKLAITAHALKRFKNIEPDYANNEAVSKIKRKEITEEHKAWEAPDVAKAADVTKLPASPPEDEAIRKDVPAYGASASIQSVAEHIKDIVAQEADGDVSYEPPAAVELVDEGEYDNPSPSSVGRIVEERRLHQNRPRHASRTETRTTIAARCSSIKAPRKGQPTQLDRWQRSTATTASCTGLFPLTQKTLSEIRT
ncbi:unnamed protein product [Symbiodinium sp. CCMP2456]|nr:unnamed protein product [Symbiodinium sp. CCMP2456]